MSGLNLAASSESGVLILEAEGRLDAQSAPGLQASVLERIEGGDTRVVLDLERLSYISSAGLRVILVTAKKLKEADGRLIVCTLQEGVAEVFRISGFDSIVDTAENRAAALSNLNPA